MGTDIEAVAANISTFNFDNLDRMLHLPLNEDCMTSQPHLFISFGTVPGFGDFSIEHNKLLCNIKIVIPILQYNFLPEELRYISTQINSTTAITGYKHSTEVQHDFSVASNMLVTNFSNGKYREWRNNQVAFDRRDIPITNNSELYHQVISLLDASVYPEEACFLQKLQQESKESISIDNMNKIDRIAPTGLFYEFFLSYIHLFYLDSEIQQCTNVGIQFGMQQGEKFVIEKQQLLINIEMLIPSSSKYTFEELIYIAIECKATAPWSTCEDCNLFFKDGETHVYRMIKRK